MSFRYLTFLPLLFAFFACSRPPPPPEQSGELVVATRNGPTTYFIGPNREPAGFEFDLVSEFARRNGWRVRWLQADTTAQLFAMLAERRAHLAAAALPDSAVRAHHLQAGPTIFETPVAVIRRQQDPPLRSVADLVGKRLALIAGSSHTELLQRLKRKYPGLQWATLDNVWPEELLARLDAGEFDAVVVNGMDFDLARNLYPALAVAFDLGDKQKIVWALSPAAPLTLKDRIERFVADSRRDGTIRYLYERYWGHVQKLDPGDVIGILERRQKLLPPLRRYFQEAQTLTGIDWRLLAALAYQESQWNALATSPTGVRGLMMLTGDTADQLGVSNRLDARQSILGGARYLAQLKDALPASIPEPDRTWMALAAYNQGPGHLEDARRIARHRGGNPDAWADVKEALPLLGRGGYAKVTLYGYARGSEARTLVESIRNYYDILLRLEPAFQSGFELSTRDAAAGRG
jgi:membrane-bound lytic murein transglycosylase F